MDMLNVALAVIRQGNQVLVSRRAEGRIFAGRWEFPGGRVEPGESPEAAAVREAMEEVGLGVEAVETWPPVLTHHGGRDVALHPVLCRVVSGEPRPRDPAVTEVRWVGAEELRTLQMPPANVEIVRRLA